MLALSAPWDLMDVRQKKMDIQNDGLFVGVQLEDKVKYMGDKTTFRLVNRKYTTSLLDGDAASMDISPARPVRYCPPRHAPRSIPSFLNLSIGMTPSFCSPRNRGSVNSRFATRSDLQRASRLVEFA